MRTSPGPPPIPRIPGPAKTPVIKNPTIEGILNLLHIKTTATAMVKIITISCNSPIQCS